MQTKSTMEQTGSPVPGVIPEPVRVHHDTVAAHDRRIAAPTPSDTTEPASSPGRRNPASILLAKLLSAVRGAKCLRQEDTCWRCGAQWASEDAPPTTLRAIAGGAPTQVAGAPHPRIAVAVADTARAATEARLDADRWVNDGGGFDSEAAAPSVPSAGGDEERRFVIQKHKPCNHHAPSDVSRPVTERA